MKKNIYSTTAFAKRLKKPFGETISSFIQFVKQNDNEGLYCPLEWGTDHKNYQYEN